eukprot:1513613-Lingulodinium_polyedra.AAC.1
MVEEEVQLSASAQAGGAVKAEPPSEAELAETGGGPEDEGMREPGEAAMRTASSMQELIANMESCAVKEPSSDEEMAPGVRQATDD